MRDLSTARQPPLLGTSAVLSPLPPASRHILRGGTPAMMAAGDALGLSIPQTPCRALAHDGRAALWLGPDERLLLAPVTLGGEIAHLLEQALRDIPHSLVDVSHRQTALEVSGPHSTAVLNAGCPLDLDPRGFPVGMCTRTVLAKAEIVLWRTGEDVFHLEVWRSFNTYVSGFLAEAAREYHLRHPMISAPPLPRRRA